MNQIDDIRVRVGRVLISTASALALAVVCTVAAHAQDRSDDRGPAAKTPQPQTTPQDSSPVATNAPPPTEQQTASGAPSDIVVTGRFVDTGATSATKLDIRVLDTPFSVASYNNNFLKAIETTNVSDLYRFMTGVQRAGNTGYDITFRGFKTSGNDRNAILTDGLPGLAVRFGSPPTIGVDHIELVKGPTSVLYGQAQPGGFINIITKKPLDEPRFAMGLKGMIGAGHYGRELGGLLSLDLTGPVTQDGALSARFVGESGYTRGFRDFTYEKPVYLAPSLTWKLDDRTSITVQGEYRWVKSQYDTFLIAPNRDASKIASINTIYQEPGDFLTERGATGNLYIDHKFSSALKFHLGYRYVDHFDTQTNFDVVGFRDAADTIVTRRARGQINKRTYSFVDTNLTALFGTFGIHHTLLVGFNGGEETASLDRTRFYNCTGKECNSLDIDLYNPVHGIYPSPLSFPLYNIGKASSLNWRYTTEKSLGLYGSDLIEFSSWLKGLVGLRYAEDRQTIADKRITTSQPIEKKDHKLLPVAGLLFEPMHNLSFYTSYSTSYVPASPTAQDNFGNNPFSPTFASSIEGGVKADLLHHRFDITAAYFDIKKKNVLNTFRCLTEAELIASGVTVPPGATVASGTCSNQLGRERSRGFEIELNATPLPNWQITAGYAHTIARVTSSNVPVEVGSRLPNSPDNAFNLWTRYDITQGALENLGFGLGVSYIGERAGLTPTRIGDPRPDGGTLPLKAYTTVDAGIYYKINPNLDLTLKLTNVFDKRYIESAGFSGDIQLVPGTPRLLTIALLSHF